MKYNLKLYREHCLYAYHELCQQIDIAERDNLSSSLEIDDVRKQAEDILQHIADLRKKSIQTLMKVVMQDYEYEETW